MRAKTTLAAAIVGVSSFAVDSKSLERPVPLSAAVSASPIVQPPADDWGVLDDKVEEHADEEPPPAPPTPKSMIVSIARETWIFSEPSWKSRRIGYLRAGAVVPRQDKAATYRGCKGGWYSIEPRGFVCNKPTAATLDPEHAVAALSGRRPSLDGLPYTYAMSRFPMPPLYARLPSEVQQSSTEPDRGYKLRAHARVQKDPDYVAPPPPDPIPELIADGRLIPGVGDAVRGEGTVSLGQARVRSGFALLATYDHAGRRFGLTTDLALLPLDGTRIVRPSSLRGVRLSDELTLPVAIVMSAEARTWSVHPSGGMMVDRAIAWRAFVPLAQGSRHAGGLKYYETADGSYVRADQVIRIDRFNEAPAWAKGTRKWIDVSILRQTLVAYEGERPVYATIVATGADGIADHEDTKATIQGTFLIHTKHVTVTMDNDEQGEEFDLRDVPFVQYFTDGYALHGAYWHDDFGRPRSHGCVNLAPSDAAWLFGWTDPQVPPAWHAALSLRGGTIVHIHP
ncbi:MAG TPA: L,D-transpeptidase [Polyangiaceae bacterium]|jgi:lipoprotein-anchoring transpeptidase ErfK/SrfK|nr:L,D-transpeptidase [Polyangiaceae bacterium]